MESSRLLVALSEEMTAGHGDAVRVREYDSVSNVDKKIAAAFRDFVEAGIQLCSLPRDLGHGFRPPATEYDAEPLYEFEEHSDLLTAMLGAAIEACQRRAAGIRAGLRSRYTGQRLRDELAAASSLARVELTATCATIRRDHGYARGSKRRRRKGHVLIPHLS
jgi:hypothetical protein